MTMLTIQEVNLALVQRLRNHADRHEQPIEEMAAQAHQDFLRSTQNKPRCTCESMSWPARSINVNAFESIDFGQPTVV